MNPFTERKPKPLDRVWGGGGGAGTLGGPQDKTPGTPPCGPAPRKAWRACSVQTEVASSALRGRRLLEGESCFSVTSP